MLTAISRQVQADLGIEAKGFFGKISGYEKCRIIDYNLAILAHNLMTASAICLFVLAIFAGMTAMSTTFVVSGSGFGLCWYGREQFQKKVDSFWLERGTNFCAGSIAAICDTISKLWSQADSGFKDEVKYPYGGRVCGWKGLFRSMMPISTIVEVFASGSDDQQALQKQIAQASFATRGVLWMLSAQVFFQDRAAFQKHIKNKFWQT